jgi:hypothetical protein
MKQLWWIIFLIYINVPNFQFEPQMLQRVSCLGVGCELKTFWSVSRKLANRVIQDTHTRCISFRVDLKTLTNIEFFLNPTSLPRKS